MNRSSFPPSWFDRVLLVGTLLATMVVPIGIHTLLLDTLGVPYPSALPRTGWVIVPDHIVLLGGLYWLNGQLRRRPRTSATVRIVVLFLSAAAINQAMFRLPIMRNAVSTRWTIYPFVDNLPTVLWFALATVIVVASGRLMNTAARKLAAASVAAVILDHAVAPTLERAFSGLIAANAAREGDQLYNSPTTGMSTFRATSPSPSPRSPRSASR